jgi:hypothetical protein
MPSGNVGVGTTTPGEELHVVGNIRMVDGNQGVGKVMVSDANGTGTWALPSTFGGWSISGINLVTAPAITGNIGIGSLTPASKLTVNGDVSPETDNTSDLGTSTKGWKTLYLSSAIDYGSNLGFFSGGTENFTLTTDGKMGIGTTSPQFDLHTMGTGVFEKDNASSFRLRGASSNNDPSNGSTVQSYAGIFFNDAFSNTSSSGLDTRAVFGANIEMDLEIQAPRQLRITAVDNSQSDGQIRMASKTDIEIHPRTVAETNVGNYLMIDMANTGTSGSGNTSALTLKTSSGDLELNPVGKVNINDVLNLTPRTQPTTASAGDIYFDSSANKAYCYDGTNWNALW